MSFGEKFERSFPRRTIKWHFPFANVNLFAVDRANITRYTRHIRRREIWGRERESERQEGRWRMREGETRNDEWICGLYTHGSITDSRWVEVSRSNPRHQRSNISIFWYRINGSLPRARRGHKFSADLSCITDRQKRPAMGFVALWLSGTRCVERERERVPSSCIYTNTFLSYLSFVFFRIGQSYVSNPDDSIHRVISMLRGLRFSPYLSDRYFAIDD